MISDLEPHQSIHKRLWIYSFTAFLPTILIIHFALSNPLGLFASALKEQPSSAAPGATNCVSTPPPSLSLRCVAFSGHRVCRRGHRFAVAENYFYGVGQWQERNISEDGQQSVTCGYKSSTGDKCWDLWHRQSSSWFADFTQRKTARCRYQDGQRGARELFVGQRDIPNF